MAHIDVRRECLFLQISNFRIQGMQVISVFEIITEKNILEPKINFH